MNTILLIGNAGKDAEFKQARTGSPYTSFTLATNERYKDKAGEWKDDTTWHKIRIIGRSAERAASTIKKGDSILIEGSISSYESEGKTYLEIKSFSFQKLNREIQIGSTTGSPVDPWR